MANLSVGGVYVERKDTGSTRSSDVNTILWFD